MVNKLFRSKEGKLVIVSFMSCLILLVILAFGARMSSHKPTSVSPSGNVLASTGANQNKADFDLYKYIPPGSIISNPDKDVVFADLDGDKQQEVIIFYTHGSTNNDSKTGVMVLKKSGADYNKVWEQTYQDSRGFDDPSGVYDLNGSGRPQIIAYRTIGASCPGILEIYESYKGKIERITGPWTGNKGECQRVEIKDLDSDGIPELIIRTQNYGVNPDVYRWNGKQYVKSNYRYPEYFNELLIGLIQDIRSQKVPTATRETWCKQAAEIYLLQHRYTEAISLCDEVLGTIDNPELTIPSMVIKENDTPEQREQIRVLFAQEKTRGKAAIYHLMGDIYKAAGDLQQASKEYEVEQKLQLEAKEVRSQPTALTPSIGILHWI